MSLSHSGSEGALVCQTSQHVGPVKSINVNPFQVIMMVLYYVLLPQTHIHKCRVFSR